MSRLHALVLATCVASCELRDDLAPCGELLCPPEAACIEDRCVSREALLACADIQDGQSCTIERVPDGVCANRECIARGCGNDFVEATEVCDDGNRIAGDGCSADCDALDICPPAGVAPVFGGPITEAMPDACHTYSESVDTNRVIALCNIPQPTQTSVFEGPIGGPVKYATTINTGGLMLGAVISPEGDQAFVSRFQSNSTFLAIYDRADDTWQMKPGLTQVSGELGVPSRGPVRHAMTRNFDNTISEYEIGAAGVVPVRTVTLLSLGLGMYDALLAAPQLSPDGLTMLVVFGPFNTTRMERALFARTSVGVAFTGPPAPILLDIDVTYTFMSEDCERLYFAALDHIFYKNQTGN